MSIEASPSPAAAPPAGFEPYGFDEESPLFDGFENHIGPFHYRRDGDRHEFLLRIEPRHVNNGGNAHGGLLAAFTDVVCGSAYWNQRGRGGTPFVTVSLTHEFLGAVPLGSWLLGRGTVRQEGGSMVFIDCELYADERLVGLSRCVMKKFKPR